MVRVPGTEGGSDDDGVFVRSHGVLHVRWNEQETANAIGFEVLKVEGFAEADLPYALNNGDPGLGGMRVEVMEPRRNESRVCECFASRDLGGLKAISSREKLDQCRSGNDEGVPSRPRIISTTIFKYCT